MAPRRQRRRLSGSHVVVINIGQSSTWEFKKDGRFRRFFKARGAISFFPSHQPFSGRLKVEKGVFANVLFVALDPLFVSRIAEGLELDADRIELIEHRRAIDPTLHHIALALRAGVQSGDALDRLYGEALSTALAVHLLREIWRGSARTEKAGWWVAARKAAPGRTSGHNRSVYRNRRVGSVRFQSSGRILDLFLTIALLVRELLHRTSNSPLFNTFSLSQTLLKLALKLPNNDRYCENHKNIQPCPDNHHRSCYGASWYRPCRSYHRSRKLPRQLSRG